jgi:hypothetical protein
VTFAAISVPPGDDDPIATLNRGISAHLSELDDKYDAFRALLVEAQASFDAPAIERHVRSAIGAHTAPFSDLISQAESAIDRKYEEISALHVASKTTISSAMTLLDAPALAQRALAAVDDAIRTATAPDGLLDRRIGESIALAVDPDGLLEQRIVESIASAVLSAVASTMDENFVSYRTCVLDERHTAEADLHAARKSAKTEFQDAIATITSDSIDTLNAALRSAAADFAAKRDSVVSAITHARRGSVDTTPVMAPPPPPRTSLETLADNTTPAGSTKNVWADIQARRLSNPSTSPADHPDTTPPDDSPPPYFPSGSRARHGDDPSRYGGARADHARPHYPGSGHNGWPTPSPTHSTSHSPRPHSDVRSDRYHCGQHGIDESIPLSEEFLDLIGFVNVSVYSELMRLHRVIRQCWHNRQHNSFGPQKESILKSSAFSTRLLIDKFDAPSVVNWYERLVSTCEAFRIGLVPFDAIQFDRRHEGLCLPGLGFERYDDMASALCTAMPICLDKADGRVRSMVSGVETKTRNGYEIVWNLLFRYVPDFDPTKTVDKPRWDTHEGDVIQYTAAFDLYFRLSAKRRNTHSQFNKSILFLKGITARNLMTIVEPLIIAIESMQSNKDASEGRLPIGYLPYHRRVDELAQKIADRCKVEPFNRDLGGCPRVHNLTFGDTSSHPTSDSDDEHFAEPIDGHMQGYNVPTVAQARKPNGQPGRCMPNTTYSRKPDPTRRMRPDLPRVLCDACGKKGHSANTCDFLAMSVFLQRYLKNGIATKDTIAAAESRWIDRWKDNGGTPTTTPSKVYMMYAANSGLTLDQMEDEMDWLCWPTTPEE